jgi:hypothetical protein
MSSRDVEIDGQDRDLFTQQRQEGFQFIRLMCDVVYVIEIEIYLSGGAKKVAVLPVP